MLSKIMTATIILVIILLIGPLYLLLSNQVKLGQDWRTASREPANILKPYHIDQQATIILFSARAFSWRGMASTHTWLATKTKAEKTFTIYQVIGWNQYRKKPIVDVSHGVPDRYWYGAIPKVENILIGKQAEKLIPDVKKAVDRYPYANIYHAWPGPNSNTFINYVIEEIPQLKFNMPLDALGRDYRPQWHLGHVSLFGILGYQLSHQAAYLNLLGLTIGIAFKPAGLIIPGMGLVKFS